MIGNFNLMLYLGVLNLGLVIFQVAGGLKIIKIKFKVHRTFGIVLLLTATIHGVMGLMNYI